MEDEPPMPGSDNALCSIGPVNSSDVKRGQNLEAEAEAEAVGNFWRLRPRLSQK